MRNKFFLICLISLFVFSCAPIEKYGRLRQSTGMTLETHVGGQIFKVKYTKDLVNAVGGADVFGGKVDGGHLELLYLGLSNNKKIILQKNDVEVQSYETTMNRYGLGGAPSSSVDVIPTKFTFDPRKGSELIVSNIKVKFLDATSNNLRYMLYQISPGETIAKSTPPVNIDQPVSTPPVSQPPVKRQAVSGGTGFLFSSKDYIITNYHVVKGVSSIEIKFPDGEIIKASVQAKDTQNDIAVLKLAQSPSTPIPDLKFGDSSKVRPGDKVFTIGYPASSILGKNQKITDGIVSAVTGIGDDPTMFQITVPIQPGNSGGPLFNERGEVIGITTASLSLNAMQSLGAVPQNINYAIKSSFVNNLLNTIPKTLLSNRGIVVVPNKSGSSLSDFFERVSNNVVLIEAK